MKRDGRREDAASTSPVAVYAERAERFDREAAAKAATVRAYGTWRLVVFAAAVAGAWWQVASGQGTAAWAVLAGSAVAFTVLVVRQRAVRQRLRRAEFMADFNRAGIARVERRWADLPPAPRFTAPASHDYATDLDLYGDASLLRLVGTCGTAPGWRTLQLWLLGRADAAIIALRQEAVREMAAAMDFRDRLAAEARLAEASTPGQEASAPGQSASASRSGAASHRIDPDAPTERFLRWAEGDSWLRNHRWVLITASVLTPVNLAAIALFVVGTVPTAVLAWLLLSSVLVRMLRRKAIRQVFAEAGDGESGVRRYGGLLGHLHDAPLESCYMTRIRQRIGDGPRAAPQEIARLRRLLDLADVRRSPLFHLPLAIVLHWDVHVLAALEHWKARSGRRVRDWLEAVGEAEALAALAAAAADHPDWTVPALDRDARTLRARSLGHPLLAPATCVRNDVEVGPAGSFLLVTGSNMSGKSTLLRAVGLNAVLAQAGGPVCADELRIPPMRVVTSMRVEDSVTGGVSFFMAGLHRLKEVVEAARFGGNSPPRPDSPSSGAGAPCTLYLLDEILRGTNSAERRIAARTVLRHLLETNAIGAVTTHDLSLADAEDLVARAVAMHFTESVGDGADGLAFDYRLRPGIATSTNALKLLEMVGLGPDAGG
ncbi:MAG: hypothetical protein OXU74_04345 [Gemmatimonadota bacterium]|nr:hypothetical protein [Gemmatimonadota bacterium]